MNKTEFPHVKHLNNTSGSPEIGTACWCHASTRISGPFQGGGSVLGLRLGRRLVNLSPVAHRTKSLTRTRYTRRHDFVVRGSVVLREIVSEHRPTGCYTLRLHTNVVKLFRSLMRRILRYRVDFRRNHSVGCRLSPLSHDLRFERAYVE